jgi:hypothetical protein
MLLLQTAQRLAANVIAAAASLLPGEGALSDIPVLGLACEPPHYDTPIAPPAAELSPSSTKMKNDERKRAREEVVGPGFVNLRRAHFRDEYGKGSLVAGSSPGTCVLDALFVMLVAAGVLPQDAPRSRLPFTQNASTAVVRSVLAEFSYTIQRDIIMRCSAHRTLATKSGLFLVYLRIVYKEPDAQDDKHAVFFNGNTRCLLDNDPYTKVKLVTDADALGPYEAFLVFDSLCPRARRVEVKEVWRLTRL